MKLIIDINDNEYMGIKEYPDNITSYPVTIHIYDAIRKGVPLEQEPCKDKEYEKDLNELKDQIFKEGNTLISKQDLLERFVEIDNEYKNSHWNLLQILTNIDILIGKEPKIRYCKDCKWWKDSDGAFRRGIGTESQCHLNTDVVYEGLGYCYLFEPQESEEEE